MNFAYFSLTDTGLLRDNNEDSVLWDSVHQLMVLADGMGGYNAGEVASAMATSLIKNELGRWLSKNGQQASMRDIRHALEICVDHANRAIYNAAHTNAAYSGMGTTLVMGLFRLDRLLVAHLGDSRCYRLRGETLAQLTHDHSLLQEQLDAGLLTPEQAQYATHKNLVTRAMGVEDGISLEVNEYRVEEDDLYLLCSDGLSDMLSDDRIGALMQMKGSLEDKGRALVKAANESGGRDNISVILAQARSQPLRQGLLSRLWGQ